MPFMRMQRGIVYGPIRSKRLGRSLGINLHPNDRKICSFDCVYCHYGRTGILKKVPDRTEMPEKGQILKEIEAALASDIRMDYITFSGNGEPTTHPDFPEIARAVRDLRDTFCPKTPIALLTNSSRVGEEEIREAIRLIDFPMFKLDAGDEETLRKVNRPAEGITLRGILEGLKTLGRLTLQSLFIEGAVQNVGQKQLEAWLGAVEEIQPAMIQVHSIDFDISEVGVRRVCRPDLERTASLVRRRLPMVSVRAYED